MKAYQKSLGNFVDVLMLVKQCVYIGGLFSKSNIVGLIGDWAILLMYSCFLEQLVYSGGIFEK